MSTSRPCDSNCRICAEQNTYDAEDVLFHFALDKRNYPVYLATNASVFHPERAESSDVGGRVNGEHGRKLLRAKEIMQSLTLKKK